MGSALRLLLGEIVELAELCLVLAMAYDEIYALVEVFCDDEVLFEIDLGMGGALS